MVVPRAEVPRGTRKCLLCSALYYSTAFEPRVEGGGCRATGSAVDGEGRQKEAHANGDTTRNAENEEEELLRAAIDITDVGDQDDEA